MRFQLAIASIATFALISGCSADTTSTESVAPAESSATEEVIIESETSTEETPPEEEVVVEEIAEPEAEQWTVSQENALGSAESYLEYSAFSREGLIKQLEFEGYSKKDSIWAVDMVNADWKEQAAKSAQSYLDYSSFSRSGLIDQLEFEGYTRAQAEYGVGQVGL